MRGRLLPVLLAILTGNACETAADSMPLATAVAWMTVHRSINGEWDDLSASLITKGYAFAIFNAEWLPIRISYPMVEQWVRVRKVGLWQFSDVAHPPWLLSRAVRQHEGR